MEACVAWIPNARLCSVLCIHVGLWVGSTLARDRTTYDISSHDFSQHAGPCRLLDLLLTVPYFCCTCKQINSRRKRQEITAKYYRYTETVANNGHGCDKVRLDPVKMMSTAAVAARTARQTSQPAHSILSFHLIPYNATLFVTWCEATI